MKIVIQPTMTFNEWKNDRIEIYKKEIASHKEEWEEELKRNKERNEWISQLVKSLEDT